MTFPEGTAEWGDDLNGEDIDWDQAWEDLDQWTVENAEIEQAELLAKLAFTAIKDGLILKLDNYGVERLIDPEPARERELMKQYMQRAMEQGVKEAQFMAPGSFDVSRTALDAAVQYREECEFQTFVVNNAAMLVHLACSPEDMAVDPDTIETTKKQLQAELYIHYNRFPADPWQRFFDDVVPGEGLNIDSDAAYLEDADDTYGDFDALRRERREVLEAAYELAQTYEEDGAIPPHRAIALANMLAIASNPISSEIERTERNSQLWACGRGLFESDALQRLVALFDICYPVC